MIVENKNEITYEEFSAWMVGMIRGKGGAIPDLDDWKEIKKMMDKVVPTKEYITTPAIPDFRQPYNSPPFVPPFQPSAPWDDSGYPSFPPGYITCGDTITTNEFKLTTTAKEGDETEYMYLDTNAMIGRETSAFVQSDTVNSEYGMADAIASMESLSNQLRAGD